MFNFFKKNQDETTILLPDIDVDADVPGNKRDDDTIESSLTYHIKDDGEIFCDVNLVDYSDKTLKNFAKILVGLSSFRFQIETMEMVQSGFLESDRMEECERLLGYVVRMSQDDLNSLDSFTKRQKTEEEPCIKPSDML